MAEPVVMSLNVSSGGDVLECLVRREVGEIADNLYVVDSRAVVERDERDVLVTSFSPDPSFGQHIHAGGLFEQFGYSLSLKCHMLHI